MSQGLKLANKPSPRALSVLVAAVLIACVVFVARGPLRGLRQSGDLALIYAASRSWLVGSNPYRLADLERVFANLSPADRPKRTLVTSLYPPGTFILLTPVSILKWPAVKYVWLLANVVFLKMMIVGAARLAAFKMSETGSYVLSAGLLVFGPVHTGFAVGQIALATTTLVVWSVVLALERRAAAAAILLGLAFALKPQIAGLFFVYFIARRQWWALLLAGIVGGAVVMAGGLRMQLAGFDWFGGLRESVGAFSDGGVGDPTSKNALRHQLVNLDSLLYGFWQNRLVVKAVGGLFIAAVGIWCTINGRRSEDRDTDLLLVSVLGVLSLLITYHRYYDLVLLVFPLAWCLRAIGSPERRSARIVLLMITPLFVSGVGVLTALSEKGWVWNALSRTLFWDCVVMSHQVWLLCALAVYLSWILWRRVR